MTRSKVPFINRRMSRIPTEAYFPIGLSLENYQQLFYSIHSFKISIFSVITDLTPDSSNTILLTTSETTTVGGEAKRKIHLIGSLQENGLDLPESQKPYVSRDYPSFVGGTSGGIVSINLGRTIFYNSLYYPEIFIQMANGVSSIGGVGIGSVNLSSFGEIPMYRSSGFEGVCIGEIEIKERYDSYFPVTAAGSEILIQNLNLELNGVFSEIDNIYLNNKLCNFSVNGSSLTVTIPDSAKSGTLLVECLNPYNYFRFPFVVRR